MKKELLVTAAVVGITTTVMAVMIEKKYGLTIKTTEGVLKNLKAETTDEISDIIAFFNNRDATQIENNGYTYRMTVIGKEECIDGTSVVMEVFKGKKKVFSKEYTNEEFRTEVRDKAMQMLES